MEVEKAMKSQNENDEDSKDWRRSKDVDPTEEIAQFAEARKKFLRKIIRNTPSNFSSVRLVHHFEQLLFFIIICFYYSGIKVFIFIFYSRAKSDSLDYEDSCLVVRYLASMRPFAQSFDIYLSQVRCLFYAKDYREIALCHVCYLC